MICSETLINDEKHLFHQFVINQSAPICNNYVPMYNNKSCPDLWKQIKTARISNNCFSQKWICP